MPGEYEADHREFMRRSCSHYLVGESAGALRCGLGDAAHLADAIRRDIEKENRGRGGKGKITKQGLALAAIAQRIGDAIWDARQETMPDAAPPTGGDHER